jgi:mannose-6-phosphate isomerase-like protein (cupin superfamily)
MVSAETTPSVRERLLLHLGRHEQKVWDWDAFPASRGYPELSRAQMRYIGAGGSPKVGDTSTLVPTRFTCSLIYLDPARYAAVHAHEIEEVFWVHEGRLTVTWEHASGEMIDVVLGPGDALLNPSGIPHGFRNDGPAPVVAQFMVGHPKPLMPAYKYHPSQGDPGPEFGRAPLPASDPRAQWIEQYVCRARKARTVWVDLAQGGRLAHQPYVLPRDQGGLVDAGHYCLEMLFLPPGARTGWYRQEFELAFMVWQGVLGVEWADGSDQSSEWLSRRDLVQVPPGQRFRLFNDGPNQTQVAAMVGTAAPPQDIWAA